MNKCLLDLAVTITDRDVLASVAQEDLVRVLASRGWVKAGFLSPASERWDKPGVTYDGTSEKVYVIVTDPRFTDHARRVADLIETVAAVERVGPLRLLRELLPGMEIGE